MGYNIGPKIGIDGEKEFRQQIKNINDTYKALEAETKALTAAFEANGDEQGKLLAKSGQLEKQIENQKKRISLLENAIEKASEKYKEDSVEVTRLQGALYDAQATLSGMESELSDTNRKLSDLGEGLEDVGNEAKEAGDSVLDFGDILSANLVADIAMDALRELGDLVVDFAKGMPEAAAEVQASASQFTQTFGDMEASATSALQAISDETNIATSRMQKSYTSIYAFSKTVGAESGEALDIASRAMTAAADSAAYYDKSIEEVTETLQSFLKGNYENDAALGISATEITRNTKANEMYAMSFQELSESQKVDVLLAMVEAGNAASGALGQAARESDSWANVTGELDEAMLQLQATLGNPVLEAMTPIIQRITDGIYSLLEVSDWTQLDNSVKDFAKSMEEVDEQFGDTVSQSEAAVYSAEKYLERLEKLEKAGLDTAESQYEYQRIVEEINSLIPGINLTIDEQTGLLEQNKGAVLEQAKAWQETQGIEAAQQKLTSQIGLRTQAESDLLEARYQLSNAESEASEIEAALAQKEEELKQAAGELADLQKQQAQSSYAAADGAKDLSEQEKELQKKANSLAQECMKLEDQLGYNHDTQEKLNYSIEAAEKTIKDYDDEIENTSETLERYIEETASAAESQDQLQTSAQQTQSKIDALAQEYAEAKEAARQSIDSQIGLFDQLSSESEMTTAEIVENWAKQQEAFINYADNLQKAVDMGLDEALVRQLSDGTEQSMLILNELVSSTEVSVSEINSAFWGLSAAKDNAASAMAGMSGVVATATSGMYDEAYKSGFNTMRGLQNGITDNTWRVVNSMRTAATRAHAVYNETLEIESPSRVMEPSGEDTVGGVVVGVEKATADLEAAMTDAAEAGQMAYIDGRMRAVADYPMYLEIPSVTAGNAQTATTNYGGVTFNIYQQPGEDAEEFAYRVMDIMQTEVMRGEAAFRA